MCKCNKAVNNSASIFIINELNNVLREQLIIDIFYCQRLSIAVK